MPVKYPCLLWVAFFFLDIPPAVPLVCAVKLRPSVRRWRFCAHHQEEEGGRTRGGGGGGVVEGGGHQPAAVSASGCGSTHITARTHMRLFSRPGQTGRRGVSQSVSQSARSAAPSGGESPRSSFNTKTSRTAASGCEDGCLTAFFSPAPRCRISSRIDRLARADQLNQNPGVSSQSLCTQPLGRNLR